MGVYDRDYMKGKKPERITASGQPVYQPKPVDRAPLWARIKFRIWLLFKRRS